MSRYVPTNQKPETVQSPSSAMDVVVLEGLHAVKHALRFGADVTRVSTLDMAATLRLAEELAPDIVPALTSLLREVPSTEDLERGGRPIPTGTSGLALRPAFDATALLQPTAAPIVLLDQPRSLANIGAAIRASAAAAVSGVLTTGDQDPWHPVALRGSAGLHFAQPVGSTTIAALVTERPVIGLDANGAPLRPGALPADAVLIFGGERRGITTEARARCDAFVALPMQRGVSSLNLATSVGAVLMSWRLQTGWLGS